MNHFAQLHLPVSLTLKEEELRSAYQLAAKNAHPDQGGSKEQSAQINQSYQIILSPAKRLKHWLELHGVEGDARGTISHDLLETFTAVNALCEKVDAFLKQKKSIQTALALAILEKQALPLQEKISIHISELQLLIEKQSFPFHDWQNTGELDPKDAWQCVRNLSFLEKWRDDLRMRFAQMF